MNQKAQEKINQLQLLEMNLQNVLTKKQALQSEEMEAINAKEELTKAPGSVYKVIGPVMITTTKEDLEKEIGNKLEVNGIKLKSLEKQETSVQEKLEALQKEVMELLEQEEPK
jgi:prefoldin beta subunit